MAEDTQNMMSIGDALNELQKMENWAAAIASVKAVTLAASRLEGRINELQKEIDDRTAKLVQADADLRIAIEKVAAERKTLDDYRAQLDNKRAAAQKEYEDSMVELAAHYSQTSVAARDKVAADLADEQAKVDELVAKKSDLQRDVRMLEAQIVVLTQKKAAL